MANDQLLLSGLLAVNIGLYLLLVFNMIRRRRGSIVVSNLAEAFQFLEASIKQNSSMPSGFTWGEALKDLKRRKDIDLSGMEAALKSYEAYRYGGQPLTESDWKEVVKAAKFHRGIRLAR